MFYLFDKQLEPYKDAEKGYIYLSHYGTRKGGKRHICPTITTKFTKENFNVFIVRHKKGIRTITPEEASRLQGFKASRLRTFSRRQ